MEDQAKEWASAFIPEEMRERMNSAREDMRRFVLEDREIQELLHRHSLGEDAAEDYLSSIYKALQSRRQCANCRSLESCPYHPQGFRPAVTAREGKLITRTGACEKLLKKNEEEKYLSNYLTQPMRKENLRLSLRELIRENHSEASVNVLRMYVQLKEWQEDPDRRGLYLYGPSGSGKTYYASAAANDFARDGKRVAFYNVLTLAQQLRGNILTPEELRETVRVMKTADVLVFDGIGAETVSSTWRDMILLPVLEYAEEEDKILIVTSYGDYEELNEHFSTTVFRETDENRASMIRTRIESMTKPVRTFRF